MSCLIGDPEHPNPFGTAAETSRAATRFTRRSGLHQRIFRLWKESRKLEFRAEFFNLFNKTNFQPANSTRSASAFGTIRSTFPGSHHSGGAEAGVLIDTHVSPSVDDLLEDGEISGFHAWAMM